ncbi:hypothetical protein [Actinocorallia longicatena]|uniref:Capsular polysaccharide biosynthesis protein n=1 Tax=Actinocorallia longicatena TaxID=111803 RepID=A0ABP6QFQ5_9ACTN
MRNLLKSRGVGWRFGTAAALLVLGVVAGTVYGLLSPRVYAANADVIVVADKDPGSPVAVNFAQVYGRLATQSGALRSATAAILPSSVDLAEHVKASASPETPLIRLGARADSPYRAVAYANTAASALVTFANTHRAETGVHLVMMNQAVESPRPVSPGLMLSVLIGGASGGLLAVLLIARQPGLHRRPAARAVPRQAGQSTAEIVEGTDGGREQAMETSR